MSRVKMLLHFKVTPYLVFDGDYLPSKAEEESGRATLVTPHEDIAFTELKLTLF